MFHGDCQESRRDNIATGPTSLDSFIFMRKSGRGRHLPRLNDVNDEYKNRQLHHLVNRFFAFDNYFPMHVEGASIRASGSFVKYQKAESCQKQKMEFLLLEPFQYSSRMGTRL